MSTDATPARSRPVPVRALVAPVWSTVRAAGFWLAVALPLTYVPLVALSPTPAADPLVLVAAVAVNLLALAVGHGHEPSLGRLGRGA